MVVGIPSTPKKVLAPHFFRQKSPYPSFSLVRKVIVFFYFLLLSSSFLQKEVLTPHFSSSEKSSAKKPLPHLILLVKNPLPNLFFRQKSPCPLVVTAISCSNNFASSLMYFSSYVFEQSKSGSREC